MSTRPESTAGPRAPSAPAARALLLGLLLLAPGCLGPSAAPAADADAHPTAAASAVGTTHADTPGDAAALATCRAQVVSLLATVATDLAAHGPQAWERHAAPGFAMASDGALAFADRAALVAFVRDYDGQVERMTLGWPELEVLALAPDRAWFGGPYDELIVHTDGDADSFGGYVTGLAARHGDVWLLERLHWSSPRAPDGD